MRARTATVTIPTIAGLVACSTPLPPRPQELTATREPPGIKIHIEPADATAWLIEARNDRDVPIRLVWDESSFIDHGGRSYGRLIRGKTRIIDDGKPQPPSTIPPHAYIVEWCIPESAPGYTPDRRNLGPESPLPEAVTKGVGRMFLAFDTEAGREVWEGALSFDGTKPPTPGTVRDAGAATDAPPRDPSQAIDNEEPARR